MKNTSSEALRAARKARLAGKTSTPGTAAKPIAQVKKVVTTTKKAENEVLVVQTDDQQKLPEGKAEKSVPIQPPPPGGGAAPGAAPGAGPEGALMAPAGDAPAAEETLEVAVEAPADAPAVKEALEEAVEEDVAEEEEEEEEMVEAYVVDPALIPADARINLIGPFESEKDAHWIVLANGEPLAKVALSDQKFDGSESPAFRKAFTSEDYGNSFASAAKKKPIQQLLASTSARPYAAAVRSTSAYAEISAKAQAAAKSDVQKKASQFRDDFLSMLGLVAEAQRTNFINENPLKEALFTAFKRAGVNDPTGIIESAFVEASAAHFELMANKAIKWLDYNADALADIKEAITANSSTVRPRTYSAQPMTAAVEQSPIPQQRPVASSRGNVPLAATHQASMPEPSEHDRLRERFSFRARMHNRTIPSKG